ncbi:MAG: hypothetical protein Q7K26_04845 [bacterium]|nr:hypothetical protein [bacterium]
MKKILLVAMLLFGLVIGVVYLISKHDSIEVQQRKQELEWEVRDHIALETLKDATFVFDPETMACWVRYLGKVSRGLSVSLGHVSCEIARRRMSPRQLDILIDIENQRGHLIP